MENYPRTLKIIGKWLIVPALMWVIGYFVVGPIVSKDPLVPKKSLPEASQKVHLPIEKEETKARNSGSTSLVNPRKTHLEPEVTIIVDPKEESQESIIDDSDNIRNPIQYADNYRPNQRKRKTFSEAYKDENSQPRSSSKINISKYQKENNRNSKTPKTPSIKTSDDPPTLPSERPTTKPESSPAQEENTAQKAKNQTSDDWEEFDGEDV